MIDIYLIRLDIFYFYCRSNEVLFDISSISCDVKSNRMPTYSLDLYGSS